jgi:hypothetical protein
MHHCMSAHLLSASVLFCVPHESDESYLPRHIPLALTHSQAVRHTPACIHVANVAQASASHTSWDRQKAALPPQQEPARPAAASSCRSSREGQQQQRHMPEWRTGTRIWHTTGVRMRLWHMWRMALRWCTFSQVSLAGCKGAAQLVELLQQQPQGSLGDFFSCNMIKSCGASWSNPVLHMLLCSS